MREVKEFNIYEPEVEEAYLNQKARNGEILFRLDLDGYHFNTEKPQQLQYLVEFYYLDYDLSFYQEQGFELVTEYVSNKGTWLYFVREDKGESFERKLDDRKEYVDGVIKKSEQFEIPILSAVGVFSAFMYFNTKYLFLLVLLALSIIFIIILFNFNKKLKNFSRK